VDYRKKVEEDYPYQDFTQPPGIVMVRVDGSTGQLASSGSETEFFLPFKVGTEPTETAVPAGASGDATGSADDLFKQTF
jgi:penicillin-binding protein 1A